ncbi:hypothetical protein PanWU01x14_006030 [Parasponia andersonii]|uniref:Uncharacterized protein n=1 Tax=Parasponia andersonii TaxID=3476 RepID=A0A2P5E3P1_PARAD|nr:hypothetical protein PanWU01x14_006030 [Parasponia andersonii]
MTWPENQEDNEEEDWMMNWDRRRRTAAVQVVCSVVYALKLHQVYYSTKHHINKSPTNLKGKKRNAPRDDLCRREFEGIKAAINSVAEAIREGNTIAKRGQARVYSEEEVFAELVNLGVDKRLRYRGYTFLTQNASRVRAFFGCPVEERKNFLLQLMYGPHNL